MTCEGTTVGQTIDRLLSEHPDLDPPSDGALDNLDQFHIGGPDATGLLIGSLALTEGDRVLDIGSDWAGPRGRSAPSRSGEEPSPATSANSLAEGFRPGSPSPAIRRRAEQAHLARPVQVRLLRRPPATSTRSAPTARPSSSACHRRRR